MSVYNLKTIFAQRIGGENFEAEGGSYKFAKIKEAKKRALSNNPGLEILDFGLGEPDQMANEAVVNALAEEARKWTNRVYPDHGCEEFLFAVAEFMKAEYGVILEPGSEILHSIGSKSALAMLASCFIDPGDYALVTVPGYPVFGQHTKYLGGKTFELPLLEENEFFPDLDSVPHAVAVKAKVLLLNYPNNPTGAVATRAFFETTISFAKKHNLIIINDAAYASLVYEGRPLSIFECAGARDVALEVHSMSKTFNMTGWRLGWVCGNAHLLKAYSTLKSNTDSGQFLPIQKAAVVALSQKEEVTRLKEKYSRRLHQLAAVLQDLGFHTNRPKGTFFLYVKVPKRAKSGEEVWAFQNAEEFSQWLILKGHICVVPWDDAGSYVRFSVTYEANSESKEVQLLEELSARLERFHFDF